MGRVRTGLLAAAIGGVVLAGCATIRREEAHSTEDLLVAAGFRIKPADSPKRAEALATMPALKLVRREKDGHLAYTYADPYRCQCLYTGDEKAFAEYKRLAIQRQISEEQLQASMAAEDTALDWGTWGPWGW